MKKSFFLTTGVISCIAGIAGIVALIMGHSHLYFLLMGVTAIGACLFIMQDNEHKTLTKKIALISCIAIAIMVIVSLSSCSSSRNGYGCKGKESWNKMVRRINSPY